MTVRSATTTDAEPVADVLATAFADDPVFGWIVRDPARRGRALQGHFAVEAGAVALPHGCSLIAEEGGRTLGAVLVLPPGQWRLPLGTQARHSVSWLRAFGTRLPWALGVQTVLERRHLREPHHYIPYVGVATEAQGRGIGTRLLEPVLDRCRHDGLPAYLEASNPDCRRLYERLGFRTLDEIQPLGAPPLWLMVNGD